MPAVILDKFTTAMRAGLLLVGTSLGLAGCSGAPVSAEQRNATDLNPSGRPIEGPALYQPQTLSNSTNAFNPLYCKLIGPGTTCQRSPTGSPNIPPGSGT